MFILIYWPTKIIDYGLRYIIIITSVTMKIIETSRKQLKETTIKAVFKWQDILGPFPRY